MTPYRQPILLGDVGGDVLAVKRAYQAMGAEGANGLVLDKLAGRAFVAVTKAVQKAHGLDSSAGSYGPRTHAVVAPHFDVRGTVLYRTAAIRRPTTAQGWAKRLLGHNAAGRYHADNPGDLHDVQVTAAGGAVYNRAGQRIWIDLRVFHVLCYLIEAGHHIGTYAICSDHSYDGPNGHAGGKASDISSIDGHSVAEDTPHVKELVLTIDRLLHDAAAEGLVPRQLITGGYGNHRDATVSGYSIPGADVFYGRETMAEHCNHVHVGY